MHIVKGVEFEPLRFELLRGEEKALAHPNRCAVFELPTKGLRSDMQHIAQLVSRGIWSSEYLKTWTSCFPAETEGLHSMDLRQAAPPSLRRYGTLALLNYTARRAKNLLNERRQRAIDAGRWWPAPSQVIIGYNPLPCVSLVFDLSQQSRAVHWTWKCQDTTSQLAIAGIC